MHRTINSISPYLRVFEDDDSRHHGRHCQWLLVLLVSVHHCLTKGVVISYKVPAIKQELMPCGVVNTTLHMTIKRHHT